VRARAYCVRYNVPIAEFARKEREQIVKRGTTFDGGPGVLIFTRSTTGAQFNSKPLNLRVSDSPYN